jgi:hypothetical protein
MSRPPTHLKIDIEGFEAEAIEGGMDGFVPIVRYSSSSFTPRSCEVGGANLVASCSVCETVGYTRFEVNGREKTSTEILGSDLSRIICSA